MTATLHTFLDRKSDCAKMKNWLRRRNVLSTTRTIRHGWHQFTMIVPHTIGETAARKLLLDAIDQAGHGVNAEPAVWTAEA